MPITLKPTTKENQDSVSRDVLFKVYFDWKKDDFTTGITSIEDWLKCKDSSGFATFLNIDDETDAFSKLTIKSTVVNNQTHIVRAGSTNFGNGSVIDVRYLPSGEGETFRILFLNYEINDAGVEVSNWIVFGLENKMQEDAQAQQPYTNGFVSFFIEEGSIKFIDGDTFIIYPALSTKNANDTAVIKNVSVEGEGGITSAQEFFRIEGGPDWLSWESIEFIIEGNVKVQAKSYIDAADASVDDFIEFQTGENLEGRLPKRFIDIKVTLISNFNSGGSYAKIANLKFTYKVKAHTNNKIDETFDSFFQDVISIRISRSKQDSLRGYAAADCSVILNNIATFYSKEDDQSIYNKYLKSNLPFYIEKGFKEQTIPKIKAFLTFSAQNSDTKQVEFRGQDEIKKLIKRKIIKKDLGYRNWTGRTADFLIKILAIDAGIPENRVNLFDTSQAGIIEFATFKGKNVWESMQDLASSVLAEIYISQAGDLVLRDISKINNQLKALIFNEDTEILQIVKNETNGDLFFISSTSDTIGAFQLSELTGEFTLFDRDFLSFIYASSDTGEDPKNSITSIWGIKSKKIFRMDGRTKAPTLEEFVEIGHGSFTNYILSDNGRSKASPGTKNNQRIIGFIDDEASSNPVLIPYDYRLYDIAENLNLINSYTQLQIHEWNEPTEKLEFDIPLNDDEDPLVTKGRAKNVATTKVTISGDAFVNTLLIHDPFLVEKNTWKFVSGSDNKIIRVRHESTGLITFRINYVPSHPFTYIMRREVQFRVSKLRLTEITETVTLTTTIPYTIGPAGNIPLTALETDGKSGPQVATLIALKINKKPLLKDEVVAIVEGTLVRIKHNDVNDFLTLSVSLEGSLSVTLVIQEDSSFTVGGNQTALFIDGVIFTITGSAGNDGDYTVDGDSVLSGPDTLITVLEVIPDAAFGGFITLDYTLSKDTSILPIKVSDRSNFALTRQFVTNENNRLGKIIIQDETSESRYKNEKFQFSTTVGRSSTNGNLFILNKSSQVHDIIGGGAGGTLVVIAGIHLDVFTVGTRFKIENSPLGGGDDGEFIVATIGLQGSPFGTAINISGATFTNNLDGDLIVLDKFYLQNLNDPENEKKYIEPAEIAPNRRVSRILGMVNDYFNGYFVIIAETKLITANISGNFLRRFDLYRYDLMDTTTDLSIAISSRSITRIDGFLNVNGELDTELEFTDIYFSEKDFSVFISAGYPKGSVKKGKLFRYRKNDFVEPTVVNLVGNPLVEDGVVVRDPENTDVLEKEYQMFFQKRGGFQAVTAQVWVWFGFTRRNDDKLKAAIIQDIEILTRDTIDSPHKFEVPINMANFKYIFADGLEIFPSHFFDRSEEQDPNQSALPPFGKGRAGFIIFVNPIPSNVIISVGKGRLLKKYFGTFLVGDQSILGSSWSNLDFNNVPSKATQVQVNIKKIKIGGVKEILTVPAPSPPPISFPIRMTLTTGTYTFNTNELHVFIGSNRLILGTDYNEIDNSPADSTEIDLLAPSGVGGTEQILFATRVVKVRGARLGEEDLKNEFFVFSTLAEDSNIGETVLSIDPTVIRYNANTLGLETANAESVRATGTILKIESIFDDFIIGVDIEVNKSNDDDDAEQFGGDGTVSSLIQSASIQIQKIDALSEVPNLTTTPSISALMIDRINGHIYNGLGYTGRTRVFIPGDQEFLIPDFKFSYNKNITSLNYDWDDTRVKNKINVKANRREISKIREFDLRGRFIQILVPERIRVWEELHRVFVTQSPQLLEQGDFLEIDINFSDPIDNNGVETNIRFNAQFVQTYTDSITLDSTIDILSITETINTETDKVIVTLQTEPSPVLTTNDIIRIDDTIDFDGDFEVIAIAGNTFTIKTGIPFTETQVGKFNKINKAFDTSLSFLPLFTGGANAAFVNIGLSTGIKPKLIITDSAISEASSIPRDFTSSPGAFLAGSEFYINEGVPEQDDRETVNNNSIFSSERRNVEIFVGGQILKLNNATFDGQVADQGFALPEATLSFITSGDDIGLIYRLTVVNPANNAKDWTLMSVFLAFAPEISDRPASANDHDLIYVKSVNIVFQWIVDTISQWVEITGWKDKVTGIPLDNFPDTILPGITPTGGVDKFPAGADGDMLIAEDIASPTPTAKYYRFHYNESPPEEEWQIIKNFDPDLLNFSILNKNKPNSGPFTIENIVSGPGPTGRFTLSEDDGDQTSEFPVNKKFRVKNSINNNGLYTVSDSDFNITVQDQTSIFISIGENIGPTTDGTITIVINGVCRHVNIENKTFRYNGLKEKWEDISFRFIQPQTGIDDLQGFKEIVNDYVFNAEGNIVFSQKGIKKINLSGTTDVKIIDIFYPVRQDIVRRDLDKGTSQQYNDETANGDMRTNRKMYSFDSEGKEYGVIIGGFHLNMIFPKTKSLSEAAFLRIENKPSNPLDPYFSPEDPGPAPNPLGEITHSLSVFINKIELRGLPIINSSFEITSIEDQVSIDEFGENSDTITNDFIQNKAIALEIGNRNLKRYANVIPDLKVVISGNVEIELGDTVAIEEINSRLEGDFTSIISIVENLNPNSAYLINLVLEKIKEVATRPRIGATSQVRGGILSLEPGFLKDPPPVLFLLEIFMYQGLTAADVLTVPTFSDPIPYDQDASNLSDAGAPNPSKFYHTKVEDLILPYELVIDEISEEGIPDDKIILSTQLYEGAKYSGDEYALTGYYQSRFLERGLIVENNAWHIISWATKGGTILPSDHPNIMIQYRTSNKIGSGEWSSFKDATDSSGGLFIKEDETLGSRKKFFQFRFLWFSESWDTPNPSDSVKISKVQIGVI